MHRLTSISLDVRDAVEEIPPYTDAMSAIPDLDKAIWALSQLQPLDEETRGKLVRVAAVATRIIHDLIDLPSREPHCPHSEPKETA